MNENKTNINWYPGHMAKTRREIINLMPVIDFVIEVMDGRVPFSSKIVDAKSIIRNKPHVVIITKKDLADVKETNKWIEYYKSNGEKVLFVNLADKNDYKLILQTLNKVSDEVNNIRKSKGLKPKEARGLVFGIPNSGKSTLINTIAKKKVAKTGNVPGFTKSLSWLKAGNFLLLDSPGILWPKFEDQEVALNLASTSAIKLEILPIKDVAYHILKKLDTKYPKILLERYGIDKLSDDIIKDYEVIANKLGCLSKNNEVDYNKLCTFIINDVRVGNIKGITFDWR
jgi:ribosome biogenesis GTPase A